MSQSDLEQKYRSITELYDLASDLVDTVQHKSIEDPQSQLELIEPLVHQVGESADMLGEEFIVIAENGSRPARNSKSRIEGALRKLYAAVDDYKQRSQKLPGETLEKVSKLTDPIVARIKNAVEKVVVIFLEFVELSLTRIMHQSEVEKLRQKEAKVAQMLHSMGH